MRQAAACLLAGLGILAAAGTARADTHAVVESTRLYMDQETKVTFDYWIGRDRSSRTAAGRATITRGDLGLVWNIDFEAKTYTESVLPKPEAPPARRHSPDMRQGCATRCFTYVDSKPPAVCTQRGRPAMAFAAQAPTQPPGLSFSCGRTRLGLRRPGSR